MQKATVSRNPAVMHGALVFAETRVPVEMTLEVADARAAPS